MPNNTHKSAAVPFVNQKGERSMKRVKVERYVAGKKPGYAKDEDEEYYTTEEEESGEEGEQLDEEKSETSDTDQKQGISISKTNLIPKLEEDGDDYDDDDDDDPRFIRLKELESKPNKSRLLDAQTKSLNFQAIQKFEGKNIVADEDEEEDEIRQRHALARARILEEPLGPQIILGDFSDQQLNDNQTDLHRSKKEQTEDILKDLKLTGIKPKQNKAKENAKAEERFKEMIEHAKQEAIFTAQIHKKIEEDNKKEMEKEALDKGDIGAYDMETVKTDDEDEDIAYEEWKLREIKRVLRDRSERILETKTR